jgi:hypothetical protein
MSPRAFVLGRRVLSLVAAAPPPAGAAEELTRLATVSSSASGTR